MKKAIFYLGVATGVLSGSAGVLYRKLYQFAFDAFFGPAFSGALIFLISMALGISASIVYSLLVRYLNTVGLIVFNFLIALASVAAIVLPFTFDFAADSASAALFPGLVIPMLLFPALAWFTLYNIFIRAEKVADIWNIL